MIQCIRLLNFHLIRFSRWEFLFVYPSNLMVAPKSKVTGSNKALNLTSTSASMRSSSKARGSHTNLFKKQTNMLGDILPSTQTNVQIFDEKGNDVTPQSLIPGKSKKAGTLNSLSSDKESKTSLNEKRSNSIVVNDYLKH
jgi:hypothetical protein